MLKVLMAIAVINIIMLLGGCTMHIPLGGEEEVVLTDDEVRNYRDFISIGMESAFPIWAVRPVVSAARDADYGMAFNGYASALWAHGVLRKALGSSEADRIWSTQYKIATIAYDASTLKLIREHAMFVTELYDGDDD